MRRDGDGFPVLTHLTSSGLGVRPEIDIQVDDDGFVEPESGGMSVTPDTPDGLPPARRPREFGGIGKHPAWFLDADELPDSLVYREERETHGFIEPSVRMELTDYQEAIAETRELWEEVSGVT
jgi:hypothetical protein